jgi:hypothetical protein
MSSTTPVPTTKADEKAKRRKKFEDVFLVIRDELIVHFKQQGMPEEAVQWYQRVRGVADSAFCYLLNNHHGL